jgi:hypothetical protein
MTKYRDLWDAVRPKVGEVWKKDFCASQLCRIGWSLGQGTHVIKADDMDYGSPHTLVCGCLRKVWGPTHQ